MRLEHMTVFHHGVRVWPVYARMLVLLDDILRLRRHEVLELPPSSVSSWSTLTEAGLVVLGYNGGTPIVALTPEGEVLARELREAGVGT